MDWKFTTAGYLILTMAQSQVGQRLVFIGYCPKGQRDSNTSVHNFEVNHFYKSSVGIGQMHS